MFLLSLWRYLPTPKVFPGRELVNLIRPPVRVLVNIMIRMNLLCYTAPTADRTGGSITLVAIALAQKWLQCLMTSSTGSVSFVTPDSPIFRITFIVCSASTDPWTWGCNHFVWSAPAISAVEYILNAFVSGQLANLCCPRGGECTSVHVLQSAAFSGFR